MALGVERARQKPQSFHGIPLRTISPSSWSSVSKLLRTMGSFTLPCDKVMPIARAKSRFMFDAVLPFPRTWFCLVLFLQPETTRSRVFRGSRIRLRLHGRTSVRRYHTVSSMCCPVVPRGGCEVSTPHPSCTNGRWGPDQLDIAHPARATSSRNNHDTVSGSGQWPSVKTVCATTKAMRLIAAAVQ